MPEDSEDEWYKQIIDILGNVAPLNQFRDAEFKTEAPERFPKVASEIPPIARGYEEIYLRFNESNTREIKSG